jgi:hypothetical protein
MSFLDKETPSRFGLTDKFFDLDPNALFQGIKYYEENNKDSVNEKIFIIYKQPKQRCKHRHKAKIHKNLLKNIVKQDFEAYTKERCFNYFGDSKLENLLKKSNNFPYSKLRKKIKKGKIRIFDDDVMVKKIIKCFCKFVKMILILIKEKTLYKNDSMEFKITEKDKSFCSKKEAYFFLLKVKLETCFISPIKEIKYNVLIDKNIEGLLNMSLFKIFKNVFVNSSFFHDYYTCNLKYKFGEDYLSYFLFFIKDMITDCEKINTY